MHEQLEALWRARGKEQPFVRGILLTKAPKSSLEEGLRNDDDEVAVEKWFALLGHTLFYCKQQGSQDYNGAFLVDLFSPVAAPVGQRVLDAFHLPETNQVASY